MAKNKISEWSSTSADNTDISNINIAEGCSPANVNNAIRTVMAQVKDLQAGTSGDTIPITAGGTGSTTATDARTALSAAKSGANSDITSLSGLTTALSVAQGGTGSTSTTFVNLATNVTGTLPLTNGGTGTTTATGTGSIVKDTSPTLTTPNLGTPSAVVLTNATGTSNSLNAGIGVNQTWSNPTRVSGTTYTNSGSKPIFVTVVFHINTTSNGTITVVVGGVTIMSSLPNINSSGGVIPSSISFIVPPSNTYVVTASGTGVSISKWSELS